MTAPATIRQVLDPEGVSGTIQTPTGRWEPEQPHVQIDLEAGGSVRVPTTSLSLQDDGTLRFPHSLRDLLRRSEAFVTVEDETVTVPVIAESLRLTRQQRETGRVLIHKQVQAREERLDTPLVQETAEIERITLDRPVDGPVPIRHEGDTMIIPVLEEILVVEKRWILREELHVRVRRDLRHEPQVVTLRSERVTVENIPPTSSPERSPSTPRREP